MNKYLCAIFILAFVAAICSVRAADFIVPLMPQAPRIDGVIEPAEWAISLGFTGFQENGKIKQRRAFAWVGATETYIFVAIRTPLPDDGALLAAVTTDSLKTVFDDAVEIFIDPTPDARDHVDYQYLANSAGKAAYNVHNGGGAKEDVAWTGHWQCAQSQHEGFWDFECAIPISSMSTVAKERKTTDGVWLINLARDWKNPWEWSSLGEGYANSGYRFVFTSQPAPAVQYHCEKDPFGGEFDGVLSILNPSARPVEVTAALYLERNNMPELHETKTLLLKPGEKQSVALNLSGDQQTGHFKLHASVKSPDGKVIHYDRATAWPRAAAFKWIVGKPQAVPPLDFRFGYYPYQNRMSIMADISGMPKEAHVEKVVVVIREKLPPNTKGEAAVIQTGVFTADDLNNKKNVWTWGGGPVLQGEYEIAMHAEGKNVPAGEIVKTFERKVYPWEHSTAGTSAKVYPPFTPIKVDAAAKKLSTVLREHTLNDLGLWDQVAATASNTGVTKPILAAPMRYIVKSGGQVQTVAAKSLKFADIKPNEVKAEASFAAGALNGSVTNTWDYDGTVRVDLTLQPTNGVKIDELTLEIPFSSESAPLVHSNSDRIRAPVAQHVPLGDGVVWDASKLACDDYIKNFCPYIFLGTAVRGICWFAENDRGWSWDPATPNVDIVRKDGYVILRAHLINKPIVITEPRTITFGLLAAPVKPRLSPGGEHFWRYRYLRDKYALLGTDINWLSMGTCGDVYPAGGDMHYWEMLAKANQQKVDPAEIDAVAKSGLKYFEPYGPKEVEFWNMHVRRNLSGHLGQKMIFYYNRASYQACQEFETFKDEWSLDDWRSVGKGNNKWEIKIVPSASYIDFALYWYAKSFEIGRNTGVNWDNWFITPSFNTFMTDAYHRLDGSIAPAAGIWGLRDLSKRTFVMMNERGMLPVTAPHMTSFSPLPMLSFATMQYDWEWKYSEGDVQDRFSRDFLQLVTMGELAGVYALPLHEQGKQANDVWTQRTFTAVRLVHEMDGIGGFGNWEPAEAVNYKVAAPVLEMLTKPGLKVYRYWDERPQPATVTNADIPTIVYSVPGKEALVVAVGYSAKDEQAVLQVDLAALDLSNGCDVVNVETHEAMPLRDGKVTFTLKKHDLCLLRFTAKGENK